MKRLTGSACSLIVVIVLMLFVIGLSQKMQYSESKLLPLIIGGFVLILAIIALFIEILTTSVQNTLTEKEETVAAEKADNWKKVYHEMAGWIFGYAIAIYILGFMITTPIFIGAYMKRHDSGWPGVLLTAVIFSVIFYVAFNMVLQADLYKGRLLMWLG